jgi:Cu+-exporting ATPase
MRKAEETAMGVDPVCKMEIEPALAEARSTHAGRTHYFCSLGCKRKFDEDPEQYVDEMTAAD